MVLRSDVAPRWPGFEIVIAGGGIASLVLALALSIGAGKAVAVTMIDPTAARPSADGRAYAISPGAVAALQTLGVWAQLARVQPVIGMQITDSRTSDAVRPEYLRFGDDLSGAPLAWMVEAEVLAPVLAQACRERGVVFETDSVSGFKADPDRVTVLTATAEPRRASLLVAADGARSRLRDASGIRWTSRRYGQRAIVATVSHERDHGGIAVQHFLPGGPFAILPLAGPGLAWPHRSSIVWTEAEPVARTLLAAPDETRLAALSDRFGSELGALALETELSSYPLGVGIARRLHDGRMALLGDAAHEIHPLAGQGLNLGIADAACLAEHVVDAVRLGLDPGSDDVLDAYERDRRFDAVALAGVTDGLNRLFSNDRLSVRAVRDLGLGLVDRASGLKRAFGREAAGTSRRAPRLMRGEAL